MAIESVDSRELARKLIPLGTPGLPALAIAIPQYPIADFLKDFKLVFDARSEHPLVVVDSGGLSIERFLDVLEPNQRFTACHGFEGWSDLELQRLDANRPRLLSLNVVIFVSEEPTLDRILVNCPHISSMLGASVYFVQPQQSDFTEIEKQRRLIALRKKFSLSDDEFLAEVQAGKYSGDPYANEWLILLNRGDLIHAPVG